MEKVNIVDTSYRINHRAPGIHNGVPLYRAASDCYPSRVHVDVTGDEAARVLHACHGLPDYPVKIYRAVPYWITVINSGDWVTTSKTYAELHGSRYLARYRVLTAIVPASTIFTDGVLMEEYGYMPEGSATRRSNGSEFNHMNKYTTTPAQGARKALAGPESGI